MESGKALENLELKEKLNMFLKTCKKHKDFAAELFIFRLDSYITRTQQYDVGDLMSDLLDFAARNLVLRGRLVYLLPTNEEYYCFFE
jgi:hypothetical protein